MQGIPNGPLYADLKAILRCDPDGGDVEPTDADHARHKAWAIEAFGAETWEIYSTTYWDQGDPA